MTRSGTAAPDVAPPSGSLAELDEAHRRLASFAAVFEPACCSGEVAATVFSQCTAMERLLVAVKSLSASRVAETKHHRSTGSASPAEELATQSGVSVGEAVTLLKLGAASESSPEIEDALREGKLSKTRGALLVDAVAVNPGAKADLLAGAESDTERSFKERCLRRKAEGRSKEQAAAHAKRLHLERKCRTWIDKEGAFRLDASLTPDVGAKIDSVLKGATDQVFQAARVAGIGDTLDNYRADALVGLLLGTDRRGRAAPPSDPGAAHGPEGTDGPDGPAPPGPGAPGSDLDDLGYDDGCGCHERPNTVHVRVDLEALRRGQVAGGEVCEIPGVGPIPVDTALDVLGDALLRLVITDGVDVPTVCTLSRAIPAAIRVALIERDPVCVVPNCDRRSGLEIDHWQIGYRDDGPTAWFNLARLCERHHELRTHKGFVLSGGPGHWRWDPPPKPKTPKRRRAKPARRRSQPPPAGDDAAGRAPASDQLFPTDDG